MRALKYTIEIPLTDKTHVSDMRKADAEMEKFKTGLTEAGFKDVTCGEAVVTRPGRGS